MPRLVLTVLRFAACIVLFAGVARTSSHYFYCDAMGVLESDPCAASGKASGEMPAATEPTPDCCRLITVAAVPRGVTASGHAVAPAAVVALAPAVSPAFYAAPCTPERWLRGRAPPLASERRAELMIFLT